jgi:hypothetical protein
LTELDNEGMELMMMMLCYDPTKRVSAIKALEHSYFLGIDQSMY